MTQDIEGRDIEPGDLIIVPSNSSLRKKYALYYTKSGHLILSCMRTGGRVDYRGAHSPELHNDKQQMPYGWGQMYIIEKNCEVPEKLKRYIRK